MVYVVDASDRSRLPLAKAELHRLLRVEPQLPVVVLGNKQVETSQHEQREPPHLKTQPHKKASPIKCESPTLARKAQVITASTQWAEPGLHRANDGGSHPPALCSPLQPSLVAQHKRSSQQNPRVGNNVTAQRKKRGGRLWTPKAAAETIAREGG